MRLERYAICRFGNRCFSSCSIVSISRWSSCACAGQPEVGPASASFSHTTATCAALTPAARSRLSSTPQHAHPGVAQSAAVCPPCAPSTIASDGSLPASRSAIALNAENSCVVFDIPMETSAYVPAGSGAPAAERGWMARAIVMPAA